MTPVSNPDEAASLDDARDEVKTVGDGWCTGLEAFSLTMFGHLVGPQALRGIQWMRQWGDVLSVDGLKLVDHLQDATQVIDVTGCFVFTQADAGQMGGTEHVCMFDRHIVCLL